MRFVPDEGGCKAPSLHLLAMEVNMQNTAIINEILFEDGYLSSDDALKDWSVMIALSRIDQFRAEKESFENKSRLSG